MLGMRLVSIALALTAPFVLLANPGMRPALAPGDGSPLGAPPVACGIDVLAASDCAALAGARIGLITNHTGLDRAGRRTIDVLDAAENCELVALFSPEHGPAGALDQEGIASSKDAATGLVVHSLYGETRTPTPAMLAGLDTLVFDVQDAGARFYTYVSTMCLALEAASRADLRFVVLDRPNPLGGRAEGPVLDAGRESFIGCHTLPVRHGLTAGEIARLYAAEKSIDVRLDVIACEGWTRDMRFDATGLSFTAPSPNLRRLSQVLLYPGVGLLEFTNLSVGRGTDTPFERIGAPWLDGRALARRVAELGVPGLACVPVEFTPSASRFAGERCSGVDLFVTDWREFRPVHTGLALACALRDVGGSAFELAALDRSLSDAVVLEALEAGAALADLEPLWRADLAAFQERCAPHLLYP
jgi:uncharacterized protein YbbC (DUF1343 family)